MRVASVLVGFGVAGDFLEVAGARSEGRDDEGGWLLGVGGHGICGAG